VPEVLAVHLRPWQVVLDNLKAHKVAGVQQAIIAVGARVLYVPPYSPEFSPIEGIESLAARSHHAIEGAPLSLQLEVRLVYPPAAPTGRLRRWSAACSGGLYIRTQRLTVA
jgi:DDE superfamily endonuclease